MLLLIDWFRSVTSRSFCVITILLLLPSLSLASVIVDTDLYFDSISEDINGNEVSFYDVSSINHAEVAAPVEIFSLNMDVANDLQDEWWESLYAEMLSTVSLSATAQNSVEVEFEFQFSSSGFSAQPLYVESLIDGIVTDITSEAIVENYSFVLNPGDSLSMMWFLELVGAGPDFALSSTASLSLTKLNELGSVSVDEPSTLALLFIGCCYLFRKRTGVRKVKVLHA